MGKKILKNKIFIRTIIIILAIIIIIAGILGGIIFSKLSNLKIEEVDKNNLGMAEDIYSTVSEEMTEEDFKNIKSFVLFGIDTQSSGDGQDEEGFKGRTDTIMIISINPKYKSIKLISIPRDTYVEIEGYGKTKINYAHAYGGAQLALKTINTNFNLNISEYVTVDFSGLVNIINDIGGIDVKITNEEKEYINRYSYLVYNVSGNKRKWLTSYGTVLLDGEQAVIHSQNRTIGDGDFTRAERQRTIIQAISNKISKMNAGEIYNLIDVFLKEVTTNINIMDYMGLLGELVANKNAYLNNVVSTQIPKEDYATSQTIKGIYYFVPTDTQKMLEEMREYIYKK
ncbi:MAG: LCP family protein [Clostridia bacterium]|nr:LCP family protein [Clostridia bacterium]